ncbi:hypothetical protein GGR56DRAFT_133525 [Xylariaceae sp. FL0804]|nr:hypothetical protein GGR56DRAFT_133525 [Xylariaceae sp. FL0804]
MSNILHKATDAVTHHGHHEKTHNHSNDKKAHVTPCVLLIASTVPPIPSSADASTPATRNNEDLTGHAPSTRDAVDLTGHHVANPDQRDIDGRVHRSNGDPPDLTGPHHDPDNTDINGAQPSTHRASDLNSSTASPGARR